MTPADDLVHELVALVTGERLEHDVAIAELAATTGLLLVAPLRARLLADGLEVRHARLVEIDVDAEAPVEAVDRDLDVDLREASEELLPGLVVAAQDEGRILLGKAPERGRHLLFVALGLRRDREAHHRLREIERGRLGRVVLLDQEVAGHDVLQLRDGADIAGLEGVCGRVLLPLEEENLAEPLLALRARVDEVRVGADRAREDAEDVDAPGEGVCDGLPDEGGGAVRLDTEVKRLLGGRWHALHEQVEEAGRAEVLRRRAAEDREEVVVGNRVLQRGGELLARDLALLEVALHERLVGLDDGVDELLAVGRGLRRDLLRDIDGVALAPALRRHVRAHVEEIDDALELVLVADRDLHGDAFLGELLAELVEHDEEVGALAVEHVDEEDAGETELLGAVPEPRRLHLHPVHAVQDEEGALDDAECGDRVRLKARIAGRVDEVQLAVLPLRVADRGGQRHLALLLVLVPVGDGRPLLDCAEPVRRAGLKEHGFDEGRLASPPMADHGDVTDLPRFRRSHGRSSLSASRRGIRGLRVESPAVSRIAVFALVAAATALLFPAGASADLADEQALADRFAPVVRLVEQDEECGPGEPYEPIDVDLLFGENTVALRGPWNTSDLVKIAPEATDLVNRYEYHLDYPGSALDPGCDYELWNRHLTEGSSPTVYGHVATDPGHPGQLSLQYWFFYVFNQFNNLHEGDWEMIQLDFEAADAARGPVAGGRSAVGYSSHEGAESADWGDDKLEIVDGTHPVVYPADGSHANKFEEALYLGSSAEAGVGCDDTEGPHRELRPVVKTIPSDPATAAQAFPWITFEGRWGELQKAFFNGPTGPNLKTQWTEPIEWSDGWRDRSYAVPAGGLFGTHATDFFCVAVEQGSRGLVQLLRSPLAVMTFLAALLALAIFVITRTTWSPVAPVRVARRRSSGQILRASARMYVRHAPLFLGLGILFIPLGIVISLVQAAVLGGFGLVGVDVSGESAGAIVLFVTALGVSLALFGLALLQGATSCALVRIDAGESIGPVEAYRLTLAKGRALFGSVSLAVLSGLVLAATGFLIPVAAWLAVRWSFLAQTIVLEDTPARGSLRRSGRLVHHHWLRVAFLVGTRSLARASRRPPHWCAPDSSHGRAPCPHERARRDRLRARNAFRRPCHHVSLFRRAGAAGAAHRGRP